MKKPVSNKKFLFVRKLTEYNFWLFYLLFD